MPSYEEDLLAAQEENKKLKQKQKDKMQPKMGKLDIDYQVLHDAFFKHQNKPNFSIMGDVYYEGKEFEARVRHNAPPSLFCLLRASQFCPVLTTLRIMLVCIRIPMQPRPPKACARQRLHVPVLPACQSKSCSLAPEVFAESCLVLHDEHCLLVNSSCVLRRS